MASGPQTLKEEMQLKALDDINTSITENDVHNLTSILMRLHHMDCLDDLTAYWVDDPDDPFRRLIEKSIILGRTETLRMLLDSSASTPPSMCPSLLSLAAMHQRVDILELLLNRGHQDADRSMELASALAVAAQNGFYDCVKLLLNHGADPLSSGRFNYRANNRPALLHLIMTSRDPDQQCIRILTDASLEKCETEKDRIGFLLSALCQAITANNRNLVEYFVSRGAPLDPVSPDNSSHSVRKPLLVQAVCDQSYDMCRLLLGYGANVDFSHKSCNFRTPLMYAALSQVYDLVRLFVLKSTHINLKTHCGECALSMSLDTIHKGTAMSTMLLLRCNASLVGLRASPMQSHGLLRFIMQCSTSAGNPRHECGGFRALFASGMTRKFFDDVVDLTAQTAITQVAQRAEYERGKQWLRGTKSLRDFARQQVRLCLSSAEPRHSLLHDYRQLEMPIELTRYLLLEDISIRGIDPRGEIDGLLAGL